MAETKTKVKRWFVVVNGDDVLVEESLERPAMVREGSDRAFEVRASAETREAAEKIAERLRKADGARI